MSVKFKVGFTIDGETLFGLIAKMLPIEDLNVEEIAMEPPLARLAHKSEEFIEAPWTKRRRRGPNLKVGINGILLIALKDKPMRESELQPLVKAAGYSTNSVASRLASLRAHGIVERIGDGRWKFNAT